MMDGVELAGASGYAGNGTERGKWE